MAFKMKAGKEGPMRKNFGKDISPMNKPLVGNQKNLPDHLKQKILDSPAKLKVKEAFKQGRGAGEKIKEKTSGKKHVTTRAFNAMKAVADGVKRVRKSKLDNVKTKDSPAKLKVGRADGERLKNKIKDITKKVADVNQGVGGSIKKKDSPKKFLGKALGGGLGKVVGKVGKFAKKNPALAGMALGGPLGGLAGGLIGAMKMVKKKRK